MTTTTNIDRLVSITGNTYPVKDQLKSIGARWNPDGKCWMIAAEKAAAAHKIVSGSAAKTSAPFRPCKCRSCGVAGSRWNPIYRSGVCKDCYISEKEEREMGY